jgi:hypothetical protein
MVTTNDFRIESERLFQELGTWRSTVTSHRDLFDKNAFLKDFLGFKMDIVQGWIEELQVWEETGNDTKCKNAIENADSILRQIQVMFDNMLADQPQETWQDMKRERCSTGSISVS